VYDKFVVVDPDERTQLFVWCSKSDFTQECWKESRIRKLGHCYACHGWNMWRRVSIELDELLISAPRLIHTCVSSLTDDTYQWILISNSVSEVIFLHCSFYYSL